MLAPISDNFKVSLAIRIYRELYNFQPGDVIELQFVKICKKKEDKDEGINHFYINLTS